MGNFEKPIDQIRRIQFSHTDAQQTKLNYIGRIVSKSQRTI